MVARSMGNAHAVRVAKRRHCQRISKKSPALSSRASKATRNLKSRSGYCHSGAESKEAKNLQKREYHAKQWSLRYLTYVRYDKEDAP